MREYTKVTITRKGEKMARGGHPWVFGDEVLDVAGPVENGDLVDVVSEKKGKYIGTGFYNDHSKIRVRLLSRNANDRFDEAFFARRIQYALNYRKTVMPGEDFKDCRLIFGEADGFPGLTVDRFGDVLVAQVLSLGMEQRKELIFTQLLEQLRAMGEEVKGIYERNDVKIRELEGLTEGQGIAEIPGSTLTEQDLMPIITENGLRYRVDVVNGQKTGYFLDQKYNRQAIHRLCPDKKVLDCFTHTGSFALNAGIAGAREVLGVDASMTGVKQAEENAALNGLSDRVKFTCADVFELLPELEKKGEQYDVVILDPPAFTKSRSSIKNAVKGYREINLRGMKLVKDNGFLVTCSCSHFMDPELFAKTIREAAHGAHKRLRQVEFKTQAPDHPILWAAEESYYLKFYIFQVCEEL